MRIIKKLEQVVGVISHASLPTSKCLKQCITFIRSIVVAKFQPFQINIQLSTIELVYNEMWEIQVGKKKKKMKGHRSRNLMSVVPGPCASCCTYWKIKISSPFWLWSVMNHLMRLTKRNHLQSLLRISIW